MSSLVLHAIYLATMGHLGATCLSQGQGGAPRKTQRFAPHSRASNSTTQGLHLAQDQTRVQFGPIDIVDDLDLTRRPPIDPMPRGTFHDPTLVERLPHLASHPPPASDQALCPAIRLTPR